MDYIINTPKGAMIYQNDQVIVQRGNSNFGIIKSLCKKHLLSYEGYIHAVQHVFTYRYKIPIYLSKHMQWIATSNIKSYENIWINYANIKEILKHEKGSSIQFYSQNMLITDLKPDDWSTYHLKLSTIESYRIKTLSLI